jgi:hypothetical protein
VTVAEIACFCCPLALPAPSANPNVKMMIAKILDGRGRRHAERRKQPVLMSSGRKCRIDGPQILAQARRGLAKPATRGTRLAHLMRSP